MVYAENYLIWRTGVSDGMIAIPGICCAGALMFQTVRMLFRELSTRAHWRFGQKQPIRYDSMASMSRRRVMIMWNYFRVGYWCYFWFFIFCDFPSRSYLRRLNVPSLMTFLFARAQFLTWELFPCPKPHIFNFTKNISAFKNGANRRRNLQNQLFGGLFTPRNVAKS